MSIDFNVYPEAFPSGTQPNPAQIVLNQALSEAFPNGKELVPELELEEFDALLAGTEGKTGADNDDYSLKTARKIYGVRNSLYEKFGVEKMEAAVFKAVVQRVVLVSPRRRPEIVKPPLRLRQLQTLGLVAVGASQTTMARRLSVNPNTMRGYTTSLLKTLGANRRYHAVYKAFEKQVFELPPLEDYVQL